MIAVAESRGFAVSGLSRNAKMPDLDLLDPKQRLERESAKLDPSEEQALADEICTGEVEWPEY